MTDKQITFLNSLKMAGGIIADACEKEKVSRSAYYYWRAEDEEFRIRADEILEIQGDFVESKLLERINAGDTTAIIFYCKTKLKHRGYSEKPIAQKHPAKEIKSIDQDDVNLKKKILSKKKYIIKLLKDQGKYTAELSMQCEIAAQLLVKTDQLKDEIFSQNYDSVKVELSREGNERISVNPKEALYRNYIKQSQDALRALGMNTESKERKSANDGFNDFLKQFSEDND